MDNVELFNLSQIDTMKAAVRWEAATTNHSALTNSVLHNGYGWGIFVKGSANVHLQGNTVFNFRPIGVAVSNSRNVTVDRHVVGGIGERDTLEGDLHTVDKGGGISICAYFGSETCTDIRVTNNLVGGATYGGFVMHGHDCGDYTKQYGNVAHSVNGLLAGHGAYIKQSPQQKGRCTELSNFAGYKCWYLGAFAYPDDTPVRMTNIQAIDNRNGFGAQIANKGTEYRTDRTDIEFNDIFVFGETDSPDCPQEGQGGFCFKVHKSAFMVAQGTWGGKGMHITGTSALPPHGIISIGSWYTKTILNRVRFKDIKAKTKQGMDY